jgi:hypothetical protein
VRTLDLPVYKYLSEVKTRFDDTAKVAGVRAEAVLENPDSGDSFAQRIARIRFTASRVGYRPGLILRTEQEQDEFPVMPLELARRVFAWFGQSGATNGDRYVEMPLQAFTDDGSYLRASGIEVPW